MAKKSFSFFKRLRNEIRERGMSLNDTDAHQMDRLSL